MDEIDVAWRRIVAWCVVRAPATAGALRPPAGEAAVAAAREATDPDWPASLLAWYRLHDGVAEADERLAPVLGGYAPLTIEDVSGVYEDMLDASDLFWDHDRAGVAARVELPAGTDGGGYLPASRGGSRSGTRTSAAPRLSW